MNVYKNKNAFITGATSGIGKSIAIELASKGCNIFFTYRDQESCESLLSELSQFEIETKSYKCDLLNDLQVSILLDMVSNWSIDILVNSAGVFPIKDISSSTLKDYEDTFSVNVKIPFLLSKVIGKKMCDNNWGRIMNIGSSSSYNGSGETGLYCSSKHALLGLSRSLTKEYSPYNVRVYILSPGSAQTKMGATDTRQDFSTFITPEEIAKKAVFLMSFDGEGISEEFRINRMVIK